MRISRQQIVDFVFRQPQDRKIEWNENNSNSRCGCIMVHFGLEILKIDSFFCSLGYWISDKHTIAADGWSFCSWGTEHQNYGELQKKMTQQGEVPSLVEY